MKNRILIFIIILSGFSSLYASNPEDEWLNHKVSINLTTPFDFLFPRYRIGYYYSINRNWEFGFGIGYGNYIMNNYMHERFGLNQLAVDYRLWELRTEGKYYILTEEHLELYFATELFYIKNTETIYEDNYKSEADGLVYDFDQASFIREKYGYHFKYGLIIIINKNLGVDFYWGIGYMERINHYNNIQELNLGTDNLFDEWDYHFHEGKFQFINISTGIKFNIMF